MSDMKKDALSELKETVPKLDNSSREMLLSYAAGMIAQKKLEEKKAVGDLGNAPITNEEPNDICKRQ